MQSRRESRAPCPWIRMGCLRTATRFWSFPLCKCKPVPTVHRTFMLSLPDKPKATRLEEPRGARPTGLSQAQPSARQSGGKDQAGSLVAAVVVCFAKATGDILSSRNPLSVSPCLSVSLAAPGCRCVQTACAFVWERFFGKTHISHPSSILVLVVGLSPEGPGD